MNDSMFLPLLQISLYSTAHLELKKTRFSNKRKTQVPWPHLHQSVKKKKRSLNSLAVIKFYDSTISESRSKLKTFFSPDTRFLPAQQSLHFQFQTPVTPYNSCAQNSPKRMLYVKFALLFLLTLPCLGIAMEEGTEPGATRWLSGLPSHKGPSERGISATTRAPSRSDLMPNVTPLAARV